MERTAIPGAAVLALLLLLGGCGDSDSGKPAGDTSLPTDTSSGGQFSLTSSSFADGAEIPKTHACTNLGGDNKSPQLSWTNARDETAKYALIMDDEDDPCGTGDEACIHWNVFNLPSSTTSLAEGQTMADIPGVLETSAYSGPCPPIQHTYKITIYALKEGMPDIVDSTVLTRSQFQFQYAEHIIDSATLKGTFTP